jgi:hypothetical protein
MLQVGQRVAASTKSFTAQIAKSFSTGHAGAAIVKSFSRALSGDVSGQLPAARISGTAMGPGGGTLSRTSTQQSLNP